MILRYVEKAPGKRVGETQCTKVPVELCGAGCLVEEGEEECHQKTVDSLVDVPEESCDLQPRKTCRKATKLTPRLIPEQECTLVPREVCTLRRGKTEVTEQPVRTEWCSEEGASLPGDTYGST